MGRRPEGDQALTGAERQARYRLRLEAEPALPDRPTAKPRKPTPYSSHSRDSQMGMVQTSGIA
jgi:hypothetical protein